MSSASDYEAEAAVTNWARQTIGFAIAIRADELGKEIADPKTRRLIATEALDEAADLWLATVEEAPSDAESVALFLEFSRKVFHWCDRHMNR
jgi:hypothetical protein